MTALLACSSSCQSTSWGTSSFSSWKPLSRRLKDCEALRRSVTVTSKSRYSRLDALSTPAAAQRHHLWGPTAERHIEKDHERLWLLQLENLLWRMTEELTGAVQHRLRAQQDVLGLQRM